jgi:hypothetical protein
MGTNRRHDTGAGWTGRWVRAVALAAGLGSAVTAEATTFYVSPTGNDRNPGTSLEPFRSVQAGVDALAAPGDRLVLKAGRYVGPVLVRQKHGTQASPIIIEGELQASVSIEGRLQTSWEPATRYDANAHPDEFVSVRRFTEIGAQDRVNRGAFLETKPGVPAQTHTRLITYARVEDLRADNQTYEQIDSANDPRPGPAQLFEQCGCKETNPACEALPDTGVARECTQPPMPNRYKPVGYRYPWVYMGPGLWFNPATRRAHVRLSHTSNSVPGLADYSGETDPRRLALAIAAKDMYALRVQGSSHLLIRNLDIRFGGQETVELDHVTGVTFDHVGIWAGTRAVTMATTADVVFRNCLFDGGLPEWLFRNDLKGEYFFFDEGTQLVALNGRGNTADTLLLGSQSGRDPGTLIEYSEFMNGHDLYLVGTGLRFRHNWIRNLNDEALVLDGYPLFDAHIHDNLIEQSLSGISMAGQGDQSIGGARYVYRNVFDLREPTAARPHNAVDREAWRYGHLFKSNHTDGPIDLFHNTFIVQNQTGQATYLHLDSRLQIHPRRSFNNIFVAVNADASADTAITYLPDPNVPFATDGNDYFRFGYASKRPYRHLDYDCGQPSHCPAATYQSLDGPAAPALSQSAYFLHSKSTYTPGFEANGLEVDPQFESFTPEVPQTTDDFSLSALSPLRRGAVALPGDLAVIDPYHGTPDAQERGAIPHAGTLRVGIRGRRVVALPH